jgi:hypothetical protein
VEWTVGSQVEPWRKPLGSFIAVRGLAAMTYAAPCHAPKRQPADWTDYLLPLVTGWRVTAKDRPLTKRALFGTTVRLADDHRDTLASGPK